ncbi:DUF1707 domain-containing protein [Pseudonocardia sp. Ae706_Ps2]|uniref:DUF1707 SHOCT-like domain-containing protein n=1 Tax=Pseudonocardia sp. Ae706_Ps2 TaxID=1885035 RepID=UPI00095A851B|nr:DUF1707 domain-containing protein [Pseudonocardia sp. Ae706_Ps2]OLM34207.1 hypothetical protein Ae717Ps2_5103c [Pseudonocardia sp. Ae717_Ps2]
MVDVRIGDAERERALERLGRHVGDGRLDLAEFSTRSEQVAAARTASELAAVEADLPRLPRPVDPERERRVRRVVLAATWGPWALTAVIVLTIWAAVALGGGGGYFWPIWVIGPWGALLALGTLTGRSVAGPCGRARTAAERVHRVHAPS